MTLEDQIVFLTQLGKRLDRFTQPGDAEDWLIPHEPLWRKVEVQHLPAPCRVIDVLLRRWVIIKDIDTQKPVSFSINPAQAHFSRTRQDYEVILKAGRGGFTTYEMMCALLRCCTTRGYTAVLVGHGDKPVREYFTQVLQAYAELGGAMGDDLRAGALKTSGEGGKKNSIELFFPEMNSHFFIDTAGNFAPAEGTSIQYLIADEMARWLKGDPHQVLATLLSHMTGENTRATLLSRPFGQHGEFYEQYWSARRGTRSEANADQQIFGSHFYQWWWNPAQRSGDDKPFAMTAEEQTLCERYRRWRLEEAPDGCGLPMDLLPSQIRWRRTMRGKLKDLFPQEFAEDEGACFLGSGNCPFSATSIDRVSHDLTPVLERQGGKGDTENGLLRWRDPDPSHVYVLFMDPAGTLGTSRLAIELIDCVTGEQVAEWVGRCSGDEAAEIAFSMAKRFVHCAIVVELNLGAISATVIGKLSGAPHNVTDNETRWPHFLRTQDSGGQWMTGWNTNPQNRPKMLSDFGDIWAAQPELFHSRRLASEVKTCVRNGDRIEPDKGMTNDMVMAMAGAHAVRPMVAMLPPEPIVQFISFADSPETTEYQRRMEKTWVVRR